MQHKIYYGTIQGGSLSAIQGFRQRKAHPVQACQNGLLGLFYRKDIGLPSISAATMALRMYLGFLSNPRNSL